MILFLNQDILAIFCLFFEKTLDIKQIYAYNIIIASKNLLEKIKGVI